MNKDFAKIVFTEEQIQKRVDELAGEIQAHYTALQAEELVVIGILRGSVIFMSDLIRKLDIPLLIDFMCISSYGRGTKSSGTVQIVKDTTLDLTDKHVLIVEDIVDSGLTYQSLTRVMWSKNPKSVGLCSFLSKPSRRQVEVKIDFCGFEVPDEFLVGYGLDYAHYYRELPFIAVLKPELYMGDTP